PLRVLDRRRYGWAEFVQAGPCGSREQVQRFYRRQGAYLALLYVLAATDFHYENVIAAGEHPVLVDLEALFHRRALGPRPDPVRRGLQHGVLAIRLLPQLYFIEGADGPIDFSGLGASAGQPSPYGVPVWEEKNTDEMRWTRRPGTLPAGHNRPTLERNGET